jgi:hypothetical protein
MQPIAPALHGGDGTNQVFQFDLFEKILKHWV